MPATRRSSSKLVAAVLALWPEDDAGRPEEERLAMILREWGVADLDALRALLGIAADRWAETRLRWLLACAVRGQDVGGARAFTARELLDETNGHPVREQLVAALDRAGRSDAAERMRAPERLTRELPQYERERLDVAYEHLRLIDVTESYHNAPMSDGEIRWQRENVLYPLQKRISNKAAVSGAQQRRHARASDAVAKRKAELHKLMVSLLREGCQDVVIRERAAALDATLVSRADDLRKLADSGLQKLLDAAKEAVRKKSKQ